VQLTAFVYAIITDGNLVYALIGVRALSQLATPLMKGVISRQFAPHRQGELFGVLSSLYTLTSFVGPLLFNSLFAYLASRRPAAGSVAPVMAELLHTNGPGLIYYLVSGITLASLGVSCVVFSVWRDHTTLHGHQLAGVKVVDEKGADAGDERWRHVDEVYDDDDEGDEEEEVVAKQGRQYRRVLVITESSEPRADFNARTDPSVN
jgi:hypothetical protein